MRLNTPRQIRSHDTQNLQYDYLADNSDPRMIERSMKSLCERAIRIGASRPIPGHPFVRIVAEEQSMA